MIEGKVVIRLQLEYLLGVVSLECLNQPCHYISGSLLARSRDEFFLSHSV